MKSHFERTYKYGGKIVKVLSVNYSGNKLGVEIGGKEKEIESVEAIEVCPHCDKEI